MPRLENTVQSAEKSNMELEDKLRKYGKGDLQCLELLINFGHLEPAQSIESSAGLLLKLLHPRMANLVAPGCIATPLTAVENGLDSVCETGFQNIARQKYSLDQKGFVLTTTYASSLAAALDSYFSNAARHGRDKAFKIFKSETAAGFLARRLLTRYSIRLRETQRQELPVLLRKLERFTPKKAFRDFDIGHFILSLNFHCGRRSNRIDRAEYHELKSLLNLSKTMEEFLYALVAVEAHEDHKNNQAA